MLNFIKDCHVIKIHFNMMSKTQSNVSIHSWWYAIINAFISKHNSVNKIISDFNCSILLINWMFLKREMFNYWLKMKFKLNLIKIQDLNDSLLLSTEYVFIKFQILNTFKNKRAVIYFIKYMFIVNNLWAKAFIDNDILMLKKMILNMN